MIYSILYYVAFILVVGLYSFAFIRTDGWRKWVGPLVFAVLVGGSLTTYVQSLGFPRPMWAFLKPPEMEVVALLLDEPKAIYVWGFVEGSKEPIVIKLPWSEKKAKQAYQEQGNAQAKGTPLKFGTTKEGAQEFWPKPVEPLPPKN